uniref:Uncharacterized protein n=1 Tax=Rhizophora mucronata TaxID=61149 RepID=A0A2P2QNP9_RHIMU
MSCSNKGPPQHKGLMQKEDIESRYCFTSSKICRRRKRQNAVKMDAQ